jgi:hypothetical protein
LSKAEAATVNTIILDQFGVPITKNGFLVDGFLNHDVTDVSNPDCMVYIDNVNNFAQSLRTYDSTHLIEPTGTTPSSRQSNGYQLTGNTISLPYVESSMISQNVASTTEYIQAYATLDFTGQLAISPTNDAYVDNLFNRLVSTSIAASVTNTNTNIVNINIVVPAPSGGSIICTKMHELGFMSDEMYAIDNEFGLMLQTTDSAAYNGYLSWARVVIDWIEGNGPTVLFMDKDSTSKLAISWTKSIITAWSNEMAYRLGHKSTKTISGNIIMTLGLFASRIIGKRNSPKNTTGTIKAHLLLSILFFFRCIAACNRGIK